MRAPTGARRAQASRRARPRRRCCSRSSPAATRSCSRRSASWCALGRLRVRGGGRRWLAPLSPRAGCLPCPGLARAACGGCRPSCTGWGARMPAAHTEGAATGHDARVPATHVQGVPGPRCRRPRQLRNGAGCPAEGTTPSWACAPAARKGRVYWVARQQFWALREPCARVEPRARSPRLGPSAPDRGVRAGSREPRCALFFLCQGAVPGTHSQNLLQLSLRHRPLYICAGPPEFMHAFGGAGNNTQGRQPLGLARSTVKPRKPGGSVNTLDAGWQPRRHDQLRTPAHV